MVLPRYSFQPNKISVYNEFIRLNENNQTIEKPIDSQKSKHSSTWQSDLFQNAKPKKPVPGKAQKPVKNPRNRNLKRQFHNFQISDNARKNLISKINWLYFLAKAKYVKTYSGKEIFNFKICFLTFTLPSKQKHSTGFITSNIFNHFLTELRQRTGLKNYVWRLEFQKNGNVHYHMVTDTYLDYFFLKSIWNRVLSKYDYINVYAKKHLNMSLAQYNNIYNENRKIDFKIIAKRYARGCSEKWQNPNSVDVKSVTSNKSISNYIAKYFGKDSKSSSIKNDLDNENNSKNLRLWYCSQSLSKLKTVKDYIECLSYDLIGICSKIKRAKTYITKWATVIYFDIKALETKFRKLVFQHLREYAYGLKYKPY